MKKYLIVLAALSLNAFAGESLGCEYLTRGSGVPFPGLSRPQVYADQDQAEVTVYFEGGRTGSARRTYVLRAVKGGYADPRGNSLSWTRYGAVLRLNGMTASCAR